MNVVVAPPISRDPALERRVVNYLHHRRVPGAAAVRVHAGRGVLVVGGRLPSPVARRLCLECCRRVAGVVRLVDGLEA